MFNLSILLREREPYVADAGEDFAFHVVADGDAEGVGGVETEVEELEVVLEVADALALYVASELLAILFSHFGISPAIYDALHAVIPGLKWASLAYALVFVGINFLIGYILWKRKIFIKL